MTVDGINSAADRLRAEFCPPLDSTLLAALLLDFDNPLSPQDEGALRDILVSLQEDIQFDYGDTSSEGKNSTQSKDVPADNVDEEGLDKGSETRREGGTISTWPRSINTTEVESAFQAWVLEEKELLSFKDADQNDEVQLRAHPVNQLDGKAGDMLPDGELNGHKQNINVRRDDKQRDQLAFLYSIFPKVSSSTLRSRLQQCKGDLEETVEKVLRDNLGILTSSYHDSSAQTLSPSTRTNLSKQQRKKAKVAAKASSVLSLTDVLHRAPPPLSQTGYSRSLKSGIASLSRPNNRWTSMDSTATYLASLMHITPGQVTSAWHSCGCNLPLTVSSLMSTLSEARPFSLYERGHELLEELQVVLPNIEKPQMERLLSATEFDIADAMDLWSELSEIEREEGGLLRNGLIGFGAESQKISSARVVRDDHTLSAYTVWPTSSTAPNLNKDDNIGTQEAQSSHLQAKGSIVSSATSPSYTSLDCTSLAVQYQSRRNECFRAAARHHQQRSQGDRGAALYYAQQGREMDVRRRTWEERAAKAIVTERRNGGTESDNKNTLDLHGLTLSHALSVVKDACNDWWNESSQPSQAPLKIITGVGRHSTNHNPVLMPAVVKLLDRDGWRWKWDGSEAAGKGAVKVFGIAR